MQPKRLATLFVSRLQHLRQVSVLFCFSIPSFSHFICEYYYYFYAVWRFGFVFIFLADLVRRCDCRRGRSSAK